MNTDDFQPVFASLRRILEPYAGRMIVTTDSPQAYMLNTPYSPRWKKELFFAGCQINKSYVSFHLMPVYARPALLSTLSDRLRGRMQGKSCFNFKIIDVDFLQELQDLTGRGYELYRTQYE